MAWTSGFNASREAGIPSPFRITKGNERNGERPLKPLLLAPPVARETSNRPKRLGGAGANVFPLDPDWPLT